MATTFATVDEYINAQPPETRGTLEEVRSLVRAGLPRATETIAYNMPAYEIDGKRVVQFAAWKNHYGLYASTKSLSEALVRELHAFGCTLEKGTIRFPIAKAVPVHLISRIVHSREAR